ncbi:hypothetical protein Tco_0277967 [Tanacetum coccineum]
MLRCRFGSVDIRTTIIKGKNMGDIDINTLTMEKYMALIQDNNRSGVDAFMLKVFPITLIGSARRWKNMLPAGSITTRDLLEKAFIWKYCPLFKTARILEDI